MTENAYKSPEGEGGTLPRKGSTSRPKLLATIGIGAVLGASLGLVVSIYATVYVVVDQMQEHQRAGGDSGSEILWDGLLLSFFEMYLVPLTGLGGIGAMAFALLRLLYHYARLLRRS